MRDLETITWRDLVDGLRRRRGLILRVGGIGLLLMATAAMLMAPTYETSATLLVSATRSRSISPDAEAMPLVDRIEEEDLNSQAELLHSPTLIRRVLEPQLDQMPERGLIRRIVGAPRELARALHRLLHGVPAPSPLDEWVDDVGDHLDVSVREEDQPDRRRLPPARRRPGMGDGVRQRLDRCGAPSAGGRRPAATGVVVLRGAARPARPVACRTRNAPSATSSPARAWTPCPSSARCCAPGSPS